MVARRLFTLTLSLLVMAAVQAVRPDKAIAQDTAKKAAAPAVKVEAAKAEPPKAEPAKTEPAKAEPPKAVEAPLPPIPKEVEVKLEAARKAVAELIVAAQDAGLVETSIEPPPILDILITGRALDTRALKSSTAKKPYAVSPEVFGAWFTGFGKLPGINYAEDVRIINPSAGLKQWYDQRAAFLDKYMTEIKKAKAPAPAPAPAAAKPAETKPAETKPADTKPADTKKAEEPKKK
jgi:hypothetical protein